MTHTSVAGKETEVVVVPASGSPSTYSFGQLRIDWLSRSVFLGNEEIFLTTTDFDLLWFLAGHAGKVLSREDILSSLGDIGTENPGRMVDMRISRLRKRLSDDAEKPGRIKTVRGRGYLFNPNDPIS